LSVVDAIAVAIAVVFRGNSDTESDGDTISPKNNNAMNTPFKRFILQTQRMYFLNLHRVL
jgi:hypothetical protein